MLNSKPELRKGGVVIFKNFHWEELRWTSLRVLIDGCRGFGEPMFVSGTGPLSR